MQVDSIKTCFESAYGFSAWFQKLQYDATLSNFAFNFNLRRYTEVAEAAVVAVGILVVCSDGALAVVAPAPAPGAALLAAVAAAAFGAAGRGLHSSTSQLNLSALYGIGGARRGCAARSKGMQGVRGCVGCAGCFLVSDTAQVELRSGRV